MGFARKMKRAAAGISGPSPAKTAQREVSKLVEATKRDAAELSRRVAPITSLADLEKHGRDVVGLFARLRDNAEAIKQIQAGLVEATAFLDESDECAALREFRSTFGDDPC